MAATFRGLVRGLVCLGFVTSASAGIISISETNGDPGKSSIIEPSGSSNGSFFQEDAFAMVDRSHECNGVAFDSLGRLTTGSGGDPAIATIQGLPAYLVGKPYIANANDNKDNAGYSLTINVDAPSYVYLMIDNRVGDENNKDIPTLGSGGIGPMAWVADLGFVLVNTGLSPNGQPDFVGVDEGPYTSIAPGLRSHSAAGLGVGPGVELNQFFSVYAKLVSSTITLGEQNDGTTRNMYGVVVASVPEPSTFGLLALGAALLQIGRAQRRRGCPVRTTERCRE